MSSPWQKADKTIRNNTRKLNEVTRAMEKASKENNLEEYMRLGRIQIELLDDIEMARQIKEDLAAGGDGKPGLKLGRGAINRLEMPLNESDRILSRAAKKRNKRTYRAAGFDLTDIRDVPYPDESEWELK